MNTPLPPSLNAESSRLLDLTLSGAALRDWQALVATHLWASELGRPIASGVTGTGTPWSRFAVQAGKVPQIAEAAAAVHLDTAALPPGMHLTDFRLLAMDMDSTLISIECVDEIADYCGKKAEVAAITEAAMRGEITDYNESLRRRVALLAGLDASVLERVYAERLQVNPGARELIDTARSMGLKTLLVSGGFTFFTSRLKTELGLDYTRSNELEVVDGKLTGRMVNELIVNAQVKRQTLEATCTLMGCQPAQAIAMGDGANDLEMMRVAGLSVAYHAKPAVAAQAGTRIRFGGLDTVLTWLR
ncbi:MAG TPA: phosphoserine phosphatase SerB [Burkholderiaceae bacterium]|nr:phosphoserine phosphatase SerB [Burkholderiaceae bacterium]